MKIKFMVEVFKTNVDNEELAIKIIEILKKHLPDVKINFDLEDCDKVLRIEGNQINVSGIKQMIIGLGYYCEVMEE